MSDLAARLGYAPDDRLLIINCDDLGSSHAANRAAYRALSGGIATSASLMVPCPWAWEAAQMLRGYPIGVHLTLTSEYRNDRWRPLSAGASLRDPDGFMPATTAAALEVLTPSDAFAECRTQVATALMWGVDVTHLDVHMDVLFLRADLLAAYLDLAVAFRLPVRLPASVTTAQDVRQHAIPARTAANGRGLLSSDHLIYPWPRHTRDVFFEAIPALAPGVSEIFAHPVLDGDELRSYDPDFANLRAHDAECLLDTSLRALLDRHAIRRISYRELRELQRCG